MGRSERGSEIGAAFSDRVIERARELGHPLCAGLDPQLERIPALFRRGAMEPRAAETAWAVRDFCIAALDRFAGRVVAVKPQAAYFEQLGWRGVEALADVVTAARERELPVVLDAKRGDIGSTAEAYAAAYLGPEAPMRVDALTVNAYLGLDTLEPFVDAAARGDAGLFVLVRTSNPGAADLQDLDTGGRPVYERLAVGLAALAKRLEGRSGWSSLGVVAGATWPSQAGRVRELLPRSLFLVPGYGAQGASAADAVAGFVPGPEGGREGGLVNSARALLYPEAAATGDAATWERAVDAAVAAATAELREAVSA